MKIVVALRGEHRAVLLRAVKAALARPAEDDFGAMPVSDELAVEHARALEQLANVRPESAGRVIDALRWHPQAVIAALNALLPHPIDWDSRVNPNTQLTGINADCAGKKQRSLQRSDMVTDTTPATRKLRHPLP